MNIEKIRDYCLAKPLAGLEGSSLYQLDMRFRRRRATELREQYEAIQPGWHMNKVSM